MKLSLNLALLTPSFLPSHNGMTYATLQHASMLEKLGHRVTIVAACLPEFRDEVSSELSEIGVNFLPVEIAGSGLFHQSIIGDVKAVIDKINFLNFHVILIEGRYFWGYHIAPFLKRNNTRLVLISHGAADSRLKFSISSISKFVIYALYKAMYERKILSTFSAVGLLSAHEDKERFRDAWLYRKLNIKSVIVPNTSIEGIARDVLKVKGAPGKLRIGVVGDMSTTKNQLAAIGLTKGNNAIAFVRFYFPKENEYSRLVRERACGSRIKNFQYHMGLNREAIIRSLGDVDLILCLSTTEAQPLAIIDGLACGLPFLSTPVGCMPSMKGGIVTKVSGMGAIINKLSENPKMLSALAGEATKFYEKMHSESVVRSALESLIAAVVVEDAVDQISHHEAS